MNTDQTLSNVISALTAFAMCGGLLTFMIKDMIKEHKETRRRHINMGALFKVFRGVKETYWIKLEREGKKTILVRETDTDKYHVYEKQGFIIHTWVDVSETFSRRDADSKFNTIEDNNG